MIDEISARQALSSRMSLRSRDTKLFISQSFLKSFDYSIVLPTQSLKAVDSIGMCLLSISPHRLVFPVLSLMTILHLLGQVAFHMVHLPKGTCFEDPTKAYTHSCREVSVAGTHWLRHHIGESTHLEYKHALTSSTVIQHWPLWLPQSTHAHHSEVLYATY